MAKMKSSLKEKIERGLAGRTQTYIIQQMKEKGVKISDSQFSRKKMGYDTFKESELEALSEILNIELI